MINMELKLKLKKNKNFKVFLITLTLSKLKKPLHFRFRGPLKSLNERGCKSPVEKAPEAWSEAAYVCRSICKNTIRKHIIHTLLVKHHLRINSCILLKAISYANFCNEIKLPNLNSLLIFQFFF